MSESDDNRFRYGSAGSSRCEGMDCSPEALHKVIDAMLADDCTRHLLENRQLRTALAQARADAGMRRLGARSRAEHGAS